MQVYCVVIIVSEKKGERVTHDVSYTLSASPITRAEGGTLIR